MYKHMTKNDYANSKENRREIGKQYVNNYTRMSF